MRLKFNFFLFVIFLFSFSCNYPKENNLKEQQSENKSSKISIYDIEDLKWLEGNWYEETDEYSFFESWKWQNNLLNGYAFMIINNDTVFEEFLKITYNEDGKIFYIVSFSPNIGAGSVAFELIKAENNMLHFYNNTNDYPQNLIYKFLSQDSIYVIISGGGDMNTKKEDFILKRKR